VRAISILNCDPTIAATFLAFMSSCAGYTRISRYEGMSKPADARLPNQDLITEAKGDNKHLPGVGS
jgi:hypothetical protein